MATQVRNDEMVSLLRADFQNRLEPNFAAANAVATLALLPGVRAVWPMGPRATAGPADVSGNAKTLTVTNGAQFFLYNGLTPYFRLPGLAYLNRADEADLDLSAAFTIGGWVWFDNDSANMTFMSKWVTAANLSYRIYRDSANDRMTAEITSSGAAATTVSVSSAAGSAPVRTWLFVVARFSGGASLDIFVGRVKVSNTTSIPVSVFSGTANFAIGADGAGAAQVMNGAVSNCFISGAALSDAIITNIYEQTRILYTKNNVAFVLQPNATDGLDTLINSAAATTNYGTNDEIFIGENNTSTAIYRGLIKFDFTGFPAYTSIKAARLGLYANLSRSSNARTYQIYRCLRDWVETQATWNIWKTANNWSTAGGQSGADYEATGIGSAPFSAVEALSEFKEIPFTNLTALTEMISGTFTNNGFFLIADTQNNDAYTFASSDAASQATHPYLIVEYE